MLYISGKHTSAWAGHSLEGRHYWGHVASESDKAVWCAYRDPSLGLAPKSFRPSGFGRARCWMTMTAVYHPLSENPRVCCEKWQIRSQYTIHFLHSVPNISSEMEIPALNISELSLFHTAVLIGSPRHRKWEHMSQGRNLYFLQNAVLKNLHLQKVQTFIRGIFFNTCPYMLFGWRSIERPILAAAK